MRLSEARIGQEFEILAVRIHREVGRRLADMGFTEGAKGRVIRGGAFRGPLQIRIRDYDVLLRRCEAAGIEVLPLGTIPDEASNLDPGFGFQRRGRGGAAAWRERRFPGGRRGGLRGRHACGDLPEGSPREEGA